MIKKFLIQFEFDDRTRWLFSDQDMCGQLAVLAETAGRSHTDGTLPRVSVVIEEGPAAGPVVALGKEGR